MTLAADRPTTAAPTMEDLLLHHQVEGFLIRLQNAIDEHRYLDWLDMFIPEGRYSVIDQQNRNDHGMFLTYDDGLEARKQRVAYLMGYWKVPRARTLHTVTNVLVTAASEDLVEARSKFTVFRTDRDGFTIFHASGEYLDEFHRVEGGLLLRNHDVVIDMNVLPDDFTELLSSPTTEFAEPESRYADVAGCRLHYQVVGDGPTVICLHGGGPGATGWTNFSRNIDGLAERFRLVLVDFPGFGRSTAPEPIPHPLEYFAEVVEQLVGELAIDRAHFLGNSTGGGVSLVLAANRPELVDRLVLMGSAGYGGSVLAPLPTEGVRLIRSYYPDPSLDKMRWLIRTFVYDSSGPEFEQLVKLRYEASLDPAIERAALERGQHSSVVDLLPGVAAETLLIWGREDRFVPLEHALGFLAGIRNSRLVVLPRCGHWVMAERVEEFNHHVVDFLTRDLGGELA